jgi:hypothetical protein
MTSEWWTYRLSDFLMFSAKTYYRLVEQYNRDIWPGQALAVVAGLLILGLALRRPRLTSTILGTAWLWVAWAFHFQRYSTIQIAATWFAAAFAVQAVLLVVTRVDARGPRAGLVLFVFALLVQPLVGILSGRSWMQIELFGLTPDPTAVGTLGLALLYGRRWLLVIPLLWCAVSGATLWAMRAPDALVVPVAAVVAIVVAVIGKNRRMTRILPIVAILAVLVLPACHTTGQQVITDRLFFGRGIPAGGTVSDAEWEQFVGTVITPRFPEGLTTWQGNGQWTDPRGDLVREAVFVVEVFHEKSSKADESIAAIAAEYKKRFGQDAVLRVTSGSTIRFY